MKDHIFQECYKYYIGEIPRYWDILMEKYPNEYVSKEAMRSAFKKERSKRGIPSKKNSNDIVKDLDKSIDADEIIYNESSELKSDGTFTSDKLVEMSEEDKRSPQRMLELHNLDPELWEVYLVRNNLWHSQRKNDKGRLLLYQSRLTAKPKQNKSITFEDVDKFFENHKYQSKINIKKYKDNNEKVLEIDIADMHNGKLPYLDDDSVQDNFYYTLSEILNRSKGKNISKIYFTPMGDTSNFDNINGSTTSGTPVSNNKTLQTVFDETTTMFIDAIEQLSNIAEVEVLHIPGNHDLGFSYYLVKSLEMYFRRYNGVKIDTDHRIRKFRQIGNTLVGFSHGNMSKANSKNWLQVEARELWGKTKYSEIHSGHWHNQIVSEGGGTIIRYLPSISSPDNWHYEKGFVGAVRSTCCFLWDLDKGLEEQWFINIQD